MHDEIKKTKKIIKANFIVIGILFITATALIFFYDSPSKKVEEEKTLAQGRQVYSVINKTDGPRVTEVVVEPFNPKVGEKQYFEVAIDYEESVDSVAVVLRTDTRATEHILELVSGTQNSGRFGGEFESDDTRETTYSADVISVSGEKSSKVELTFR